MSNPLIFISDALVITKDAFRVARACADFHFSSGVAGTQFDPPDLGLADTLIEVANAELDDLIVLGMVASFEAHLKKYITSRLRIDSGAYQSEIDTWLTDRIENAPLYRIDGIFKPPVTQSMIDDVDDVRKYRNWVAHGRLASRKPARTVNPDLAYNILTHFMATAGII
jgi:hypothetical protein